jgi:Ice-binding-like
VTLANGAQAGNVFWVVGSSFTAVATSTMVGTIMAAVSITLGGGVLNGRALASTGAVTMSTTTTLTLPTTTTGAVGNTYPAFAVFGSYVLALPGQVAKVAFITTMSVKVGSPLIIGLLIDEALPYYKGSFDIIKTWVNDPPNLPESKSFFKQRFYLSENHEETAYCSDLQFMVQWPAEAAQNELQSFTIWGAYEVEA